MAQNRNADPKAQARDLLQRLNMRTSPIPVEKIPKALGIQVRFSPLDQELSGMIYVKDNLTIIGVNSFHHPNRQRFTIAHEIGHYELHRDVISRAVHVDRQYAVLRRDEKSATGTDKMEIQANQFAAELLIPEFLLVAFFKGMAFDIDDQGPRDELAKRFKVSRQMVDFRLAGVP